MGRRDTMLPQLSVDRYPEGAECSLGESVETGQRRRGQRGAGEVLETLFGRVIFFSLLYEFAMEISHQRPTAVSS